MKKILLSALFMSVISMNVFAGENGGGRGAAETNCVTFVNLDVGRYHDEVFINLRHYRRFIDFINDMREIIDLDRERPYVEGSFVNFYKNGTKIDPYQDIGTIRSEDFFTVQSSFRGFDEALELPPKEDDPMGDFLYLGEVAFKSSDELKYELNSLGTIIQDVYRFDISDIVSVAHLEDVLRGRMNIEDDQFRFDFRTFDQGAAKKNISAANPGDVVVDWGSLKLSPVGAPWVIVSPYHYQDTES